MLEFTHDAPAARVVFGAGSLARLGDEVLRLGARRVLLLCTPRQRALAESAAAVLGDHDAAAIYDRAAEHVPLEVAEDARAVARQFDADCCVALGGGSTVGLAKAIALVAELPIIAVPTTYAGSEMTPIWGITVDGQKQTGRDRRVLPRTVLYDPALTLGLPPQIAGPSGINALAHCVEALYANDGSPLTALLAEEGARALAQGLPRVVRAPQDLDARSDALYGAWLAGAALGAVSMGLHHKLCHTLGGTFGLPHAQTHTVVLPHAAAYNAAAAPLAMGRVARALGVTEAPGGLFDLAGGLGATMALRDLGLRQEDLERAAEITVSAPYPNPAPITRDGVLALLRAAWEGRRPG